MTHNATLHNEPFDVLVVDDQPMICEAVRRLLADTTRARVHGCVRAADALSRAMELCPCVILQDINLPDGNGLDLVAAYRAQPILEGCSIVMLSATDDPAVKARAFALGADDYIEKLPPSEEFVARLLHHAQASRALAARNAAMRALEEKDHELQVRNSMLDEANERLAHANQVLEVDNAAQRRRVESLASAGIGLAQIQDLDLLLNTILDKAANFAGASSGAVFVREGNELRATTVFSHGVSSAAGTRFPRTQIDRSTVIGSIAASGHALRVEKFGGATDVHHIRLRDRSSSGVPVAPDGILPSAPASMLFLPITRGSTVLGVIALCDASDDDGFSIDDERLLRHFAGLAAAALAQAQTARSLIFRMVAMAALRDPTETAGHVQRVAEISVIVFDAWADAHHLASDVHERDRDRLRCAAMLHDVGKVGIGDAILKKPGKLDAEERIAMERHCKIGADLFSELDKDDATATVVLCHQEKWDGTGYPRKLRGEDIPFFARIVAIADVYDALGTRRSYKEPWSRERIESYFRDESGKHFDPELAQILLDNIDKAECVRDTFTEHIAAHG